MNDAMNIAASGLFAAQASLQASASNIANMQSDGPVPSTPPTQAVPQTGVSVYQPVAVSQVSLPNGGVSATEHTVLPSYRLAYNPAAPFADAQGMVAVPNVDLSREVMNQVEAAYAYKANLHTFSTASETVKTLLSV